MFVLSAFAALMAISAASLPAAAIPPVERTVQFTGAGGASLTGTLVLPTHGSGRLPALLLVPGSGPTDRDGNQLPAFRTDLLRQIAAALAADGVASFRFDKRGVGASRTEQPTGEKLEEYAAWSMFVGDATAAFHCLIAQPEIDPLRAGMLGHSEGGTIVLDAARTLEPKPATSKVVLLLSTPGRRSDAVITDQLRSMLNVQGATAEQSKYFLDKNEAITRTIERTGHTPQDVPPGLAPLYPAYIGRFFQGELAVDPVAIVRNLTAAILVLQGDRDVQVSPTKDGPALEAALEARAGHPGKYALIAGASHNLKPVDGPADPGFEGPIAPESLKQITAFLKEQL